LLILHTLTDNTTPKNAKLAGDFQFLKKTNRPKIRFVIETIKTMIKKFKSIYLYFIIKHNKKRELLGAL